MTQPFPLTRIVLRAAAVLLVTFWSTPWWGKILMLGAGWYLYHLAATPT